jgi:hypothetical protein
MKPQLVCSSFISTSVISGGKGTKGFTSSFFGFWLELTTLADSRWQGQFALHEFYLRKS